MRRELCLVGCLVTLGLVGRAVGSEGAPPGLDYRVAPGVERCPTQAQFQELLVREVGSNPFADDPALSIRIELSPRQDGVAGSVELSEKGEVKGHRELSSGECGALATALALVVGVELDPLALSRRSGAQAAASVPAEVRSTAPVERRHDGPDLFVSTGALAVYGAMPTVAGAVVLGLSARWWSWFQAGIEGQGTLPASEFNVSQVLAIGSACAARWSLALCGLLAVGSQTDTGGGVTSSGFYVAPGVRLDAEIALNPNLSLVPRADVYFLAIPLRIGQPEPNGQPPKYQAPPVNGSIGLAFQARIL
jgi:hypothetical protein